MKAVFHTLRASLWKTAFAILINKTGPPLLQKEPGLFCFYQSISRKAAQRVLIWPTSLEE